jgi:alkanesulfonate monooxygenase
VQFEFNWHIPCAGDGHWICTRTPERLPHAEYLIQVARAAEYAGFDRVLVPCAFSNGTYSLAAPYVDAWTLGTAVIGATSRIEVLIAHRPGFINPGLFAQMCATADDYAQGRLAVNIVTAGAPGDMEQFGDVLDHDSRYRRAVEFASILKSLWTQSVTNFEGEFYRMIQAGLQPKPVRPGGPPFFLAGASEAAIDMAARQADVYMMSASTVPEIARRIEDVRRRASDLGRSVRFCVAANLFARATESDARALAEGFSEHADLQVVAERTASGRQTTSVEDLRARAGTNLHTWTGPHLWSGIAHLIYGSAWVGSYAQITELFEQYAEVGVSVFQIYGYPFL